MDPISIATACLALISAAGKTSLAVTKFVRGCYEARSDLAGIAGELSQLQLIIELLKDDSAVNDSSITPESLQAQVLSTIKNCMAIIEQINDVVQKHQSKIGAVKWASYGKTEIAGLRMSLEAHRGSLNLMLELVSLSLSKAVKEDTASIRAGVTEIKQDTSHMPQILEELVRLRAIVASGEIPSTAHDRDFVLQQYLDNLTSYAETVCGDIAWDSDHDAGSDSDDGSTHTITKMPSAITSTQDDEGRAESSPTTVAKLRSTEGPPHRSQIKRKTVPGVQEDNGARLLENKSGGDDRVRKSQAPGVDKARSNGVANEREAEADLRENALVTSMPQHAPLQPTMSTSSGTEIYPPEITQPAHRIPPRLNIKKLTQRKWTAEDHLNEGIDLSSQKIIGYSRRSESVEHFRLAAKLGHPISVILYVRARYKRDLDNMSNFALWFKAPLSRHYLVI